MSSHAPHASSPLPPDPNIAVRRELARERRPIRPTAILLTIGLLLAGAAGVGGWLTGPGGLLAASSTSPTWVQDTSPSLHWSAGWTVTKTSLASGGTLHTSAVAGASVSLSYTGSYLRIVAPTGRGRGSITVKLDGQTTSVSTHGTIYRAGQVVFQSAGKAGNSHTLTVTVDGTSGHPTVSLDAFVVSQPVHHSSRSEPGSDAHPNGGRPAAPRPPRRQTPSRRRRPRPSPTPTPDADADAQSGSWLLCRDQRQRLEPGHRGPALEDDPACRRHGDRDGLDPGRHVRPVHPAPERPDLLVLPARDRPDQQHQRPRT